MRRPIRARRAVHREHSKRTNSGSAGRERPLSERREKPGASRSGRRRLAAWAQLVVGGGLLEGVDDLERDLVVAGRGVDEHRERHLLLRRESPVGTAIEGEPVRLQGLVLEPNDRRGLGGLTPGGFSPAMLLLA